MNVQISRANDCVKSIGHLALHYRSIEDGPAAAKLLDLLGQPSDQRTFAAIGTRLAPGTALPAPVGVFPRYQVE